MITCPCGYVAAATIGPMSPTWHRQHRDHHLRVYPLSNATTRESLDDMIASAERHQQLTKVGTVQGPDPEGVRARRAQRRDALMASPRRGARRKAAQA